MADTRKFLTLAVLVLGVGSLSQWWGHREEAAVGRELASMAKPGDIVMISSSTCGYCNQARAWFKEHRVAFSECVIETDADCAMAYRAVQSPGTPFLIVRQRTQLGFSAERVRDLLRSQQSG